MTTDGSLLLTGGQGYSGGWRLLRHGGRSWCQVREPDRQVQHRQQITPLTVVGDQVWWLTGLLDSSPAPTVNQLPISALAC